MIDWLGGSQSDASRSGPALAVNVELIHLFHGIGREILDRQAYHGWGARVILGLKSEDRRPLRGWVMPVLGFCLATIPWEGKDRCRSSKIHESDYWNREFEALHLPFGQAVFQHR